MKTRHKLTGEKDYFHWIMIRLLLILSLLLVYHDLFSQYGPHSVEASFTGGVNSYSYQNDSLVIPNKRGKIGFGNDVSVGIEYQYHFIKRRLALKAGIGYSEKEIYMEKYGLGDIFQAFLSFGGFHPDTFYLYRINIKAKYVSVPFTFYYRLTNNLKQGAQFFVGLQVNSNFRLHSLADASFDSSYNIGSPQLKQRVETLYSRNMQNFLVSISPRIDLRIRCYKNIGVLLNLFPFSFYCSSWTKNLTSAGSNFSATFGIYYNFSKNKYD